MAATDIIFAVIGLPCSSATFAHLAPCNVNFFDSAYLPDSLHRGASHCSASHCSACQASALRIQSYKSINKQTSRPAFCIRRCCCCRCRSCCCTKNLIDWLSQTCTYACTYAYRCWQACSYGFMYVCMYMRAYICIEVNKMQRGQHLKWPLVTQQLTQLHI